MYNVYFQTLYNDKQALNLEVICTFHSIAWFKDTVHMIPYPLNSLFLHIKVGNKEALNLEF